MALDQTGQDYRFRLFAGEISRAASEGLTASWCGFEQAEVSRGCIKTAKRSTA